MRVAVIGCGYVGLVASACLAKLGHSVHCADIDKHRVACIKSGGAPFYEPGLAAALKAELSFGRLAVDVDITASIVHADIVFIAVGTPACPDGGANLDFVETAVAQTARSMRAGCLIVIKSTVPVGTCRRMQQLIRQLRPGVPFSLASNPEFLRQGTAISDFMSPERIVLGIEDDGARQALRQLYAPLEKGGARVVETDLEGAELIKYVANAFLATRIALINEVADLCERVGASVDKVAEAVGLDTRIGARFLEAGPGFGGSCFPKDLRALAAMGRQHGARQSIVEQVERANEERKLALAQRVLRLLGDHPAGKTVGVLGVTFKAHTDDIRGAPSLTIIGALQAAGVSIRAHDCAAEDGVRDALTGISWCASPYDAASGADLLLLLTDWPEYRQLDLVGIAVAMKGRIVFDTRRIVSAGEAARRGLQLIALGCPPTPNWMSHRAEPANDCGWQAVPHRPVVTLPDNDRKIMVAGGAGFLGTHLCERLLRDGHHVLCVDNLSTGQASSVWRLAQYRRFSFLRHDVTDPIGAQVDEIFNLACPASPPQYQADPVRTVKTSILGAYNLLELAGRLGAKILQASTSEVYGDPAVHPQAETYWGHVNPIGVRACYDEGKRCSETLFFDYWRQGQVRIRVARIFNTYGPYMQLDDGRVVSNFVVQALSGENLTIYGDGQQTRSFCFVDDLIDGLVRLMDAPDSITGPINLGNPSEFTILELAKLVQAVTGLSCRLVFMPMPQDDPRQRKPDIAQAEQTLGWRPKVSLHEGLLQTIPYFAEMLGRPLSVLEERTRERSVADEKVA